MKNNGINANYLQPSFLEFSDVIIDNLLEYLNPNALIRLREVSLTCKTWVESRQRILQRIPVTVTVTSEAEEEDIVEEFLKSRVKWSNIVLILRSNFAQSMPLVRRILNFVQNDLKLIKIILKDPDGADTIECTDLLEILLTLGPTLESFSFEDLFYPFNPDDIIRHPAVDETELEIGTKLKLNLSRLKYVEFVHFEQFIPYRVRFLQQLILSNISSDMLLSIKTPFTQEQTWVTRNTETNEEERIQYSSSLIVLQKFLRGMGHTCRKIHKPRLTIEFCHKWYHLAQTKPLAQVELAELVELCTSRSREVILLNVPHIALPSCDDDLTDHVKKNFNNVVKSVSLANVLNSDTPPHIPISAEISISNQMHFLGDGVLPVTRHLDMPTTFNVTLVELSCVVQDGAGVPAEQEQLLYQNLIGQIRPTVKELVLTNYDFGRLERVVLSTIFPNLETLTIVGDVPKECMADLLNGMDHLQSVTFKKCDFEELSPLLLPDKNLPLILQLKQLREFRLVDCSLAQISIEGMKDALMYMKLKRFIFKLVEGGDLKRYYLKIRDNDPDGTLYLITTEYKKNIEDMLCVVPFHLNRARIAQYYARCYNFKDLDVMNSINEHMETPASSPTKIKFRIVRRIIGFVARVFF